MLLATTIDIQDLPARERMLHTAHRLFYQDGIRATGIDKVIAESGVTKVTLYRHFASKNDLICAYLEYRHTLWIDWFADALRRHGSAKRGAAKRLAALPLALSEWFGSEGFRGCAFINSVAELGDTLPQANEIVRRHKQDMTDLLANLLPPSQMQAQDAKAIALVVEGAIVRVQLGEPVPAVITSVARLLALFVLAQTTKGV